MKSKKTYQNYEVHLSNLHCDAYTLEDVLELFAHYQCRQSTLVNAYRNRTLGVLIRKHDPIAFNVGFGEWNPDK